MKTITDRLNIINFKASVKASTASMREQRALHRSLVKYARKLSTSEDPEDKKKLTQVRFYDLGTMQANFVEGSFVRRIQLLAYCYMKGRTYRQCEQKGTFPCTHKAVAEKMLAEIIKYDRSFRYGTAAKLEGLLTWLDNGEVTRATIEAPITTAKAA